MQLHANYGFLHCEVHLSFGSAALFINCKMQHEPVRCCRLTGGGSKAAPSRTDSFLLVYKSEPVFLA